MLKQLKGKDLPSLRKRWWLENDKKCPILGVEIDLADTTLDHQHKLKGELADETGKGICRGVLSRIGNSWEGKITNNFKRLGLYKHIDIVTALRNLADYLEHNHIEDEIKYIHPSEAPRRLKIKKSCYNKLIKAVSADDTFKKAVPKYTGNVTKPLVALFEKYQIEIEYYEN